MANPISEALDTLTARLQTAVGSGTVVTRDPAMIGPRVASTGVAVLIGAAVPTEASSYLTWLLSVPVHVCFDAPADPRHLDPAYTVIHQILGSDDPVASAEVGTVTLDAAMTVPAITVTLQISTEC